MEFGGAQKIDRFPFGKMRKLSRFAKNVSITSWRPTVFVGANGLGSHSSESQETCGENTEKCGVIASKH